MKAKTTTGKTDAAKRLDELVSKREELRRDFEALASRLREEQERDAVDIILGGGSIDDAVRPIQEERGRIQEKIGILDRAIREMAATLEREKIEAGRKARAERQKEFEGAVRDALKQMDAAHTAVGRVDDISRELEAAGHAGFPPLPWPLKFANYEARKDTFKALCGINL